jgi:Ca2+-transporting ATPase
LSNSEAAARLDEHGPNQLESRASRSVALLLVGQFRNTLIILLLVATGLSLAAGHVLEAVTIGFIVGAAAVLGFVQEYRAEKVFEELNKLAAPRAVVVRDGISIEVASRTVVPGDIEVLRAGRRVAADGRVVEAAGLEAQEAVLTGESLPVSKTTAPLSEATLVAGDRTNIVYAGTLCAAGRGRAIVVATGRETEFGRVAQMLEQVAPERTPLQKNLDAMAAWLARGAVVLAAVVVVIESVRGAPPVDAVLFGAALAVAVVPEALPAVVTIALALGAQRMAERQTLVRKLAAVETLGSTSVICADKTGTLTQDEMSVRRVFVGGHRVDVGRLGDGGGEPDLGVGNEGRGWVDEPLRQLLTAAVLASDVDLGSQADGTAPAGDATEAALAVLAARAGLNRQSLEAQQPRIDEVPFSSERRRMATIHDSPAGAVAYVKGAPEDVIGACDRILTADGLAPLDSAGVEKLHSEAHAMADEGLRVIALATRHGATVHNVTRGLVFLGLAGIADPPRPEARQALATCRRAGIMVKMITGDHPGTARAVATEIGVAEPVELVTGSELEAMSDVELERAVERIQVFARVSPEQKLRIVAALQSRGHVVAMTGDGVNDAPALKRADIGVAMGVKGTDVAREAADVTLVDDNFASIVSAVGEGRTIFANIKKSLMFLLSSNVGEIGLMAGALVAGLPLPLGAVQILFVNLATDGPPALALAVDPPDPDVMQQPPRRAQSGLFTRRGVAIVGVAGAWAALVNLGLFAWTLEAGHGLERAQGVTFIALIVIQLTNAYNFRSEDRSAIHRPLANRWLNAATALVAVVLVAMVYGQWFNQAFGTVPLSAAEWLLILGVALSSIPVYEFVTRWLPVDSSYTRAA